MSGPRKLAMLLLLFAPLALAALALPSLELHLAQRALDKAVRAHDDLRAGTLSRVDQRGFLLDHVALDRSSATLTCTDILLHPNRRAILLGGRPLHHVDLDTCALTLVPRSEGNNADRDPESREAAGRDPSQLVRTLLAELAPRSATLSIRMLTLRTPAGWRARLANLDVSLPTDSGTGAEARAVLTELDAKELPFALAAPMPLRFRAGAALRLTLPEGASLTTPLLEDETLHIELDSMELMGAEVEIRDMTLSIRSEPDLPVLDVARIRFPGGATRPRLALQGLYVREGATRRIAAQLAHAGILPLAPPAAETPEEIHDAEEITDDEAPPLTRRERLARRAERSREVRESIRLNLMRADRKLRALPAHIARLDPARWPFDLQLADLRLRALDREVRVEELHLDGTRGILLRGEMDGQSLQIELGTERSLLFFETGGWQLGGLLPLIEEGRVVGRTTLHAEEEVLALELSLRFEDLALHHEAIATTTIGPFPFSLAGRVELGSDGALRVSLQPAIGEVRGELNAELSGLEEGATLSLQADLGEGAACAAIWNALPPGLTPELAEAGLRWEGRVTPQVSLTYRLGAPSSLRLRAFAPDTTCRVSAIARHLDPSRLNRADFVHRVEEGTERDDIRVGPGTENWVPINELPSYIPALMYLSEEIAFFRNVWISVPLLNRALRMNIERGYYVYGGSTVTQQLVKNLWLTREKTLSRKIEEAIIVWALEERVSKARVLEMYINVIEYGPDIFGLQEAARHYFGVDARELTPLEAAFLAALKPSPRIGEQWRRRGQTPDRGWFPERLALLLERLVTHGRHIEPEEVAHFAPWVLHWPLHPNAGSGDPTDPPRAFRTPRPEGARTWFFQPEDPEHQHAKRLDRPLPSQRSAPPPEREEMVRTRRPGTR